MSGFQVEIGPRLLTEVMPGLYMVRTFGSNCFLAVEDELTLIDTGAPTYVNAITLQFQKEGSRLSGHWIAAYPAAEAGATASGAGVTFTGRRLGKGGNGPNARPDNAR
jgi:hypothetical protein